MDRPHLDGSANAAFDDIDQVLSNVPIDRGAISSSLITERSKRGPQIFMTSNDEKKVRDARLDALKRKREEVKASGFKASEEDGQGEGLKKLLQARGGAGGGGGGAGKGAALRKLLANRPQGDGDKAQKPAGGGDGAGLRRLLQARQSKGSGAGSGKADGADELQARRERLKRFIALLQKDDPAGA
jgi:hypothetical protein